MAIKPADMDSCTPKCKCLSGPNTGQAYECGDPCPNGQDFDKLTCNCTTPGVEGAFGRYRVEFYIIDCSYGVKACSGLYYGDSCNPPRNGSYSEDCYGMWVEVIPYDHSVSCGTSSLVEASYYKIWVKEVPNGPWVFRSRGNGDYYPLGGFEARYTKETTVTGYTFNGNPI